MSLQYDALHDGIVRCLEAQGAHNKAVERFVESVEDRFATEERLISELRDDLHALANRLEALTRAAS